MKEQNKIVSENIAWHSISGAESVKKLCTDTKKGLSAAEAQKRLSKYGANTITQKKKTSIFIRFLMQFADFMVLILLIAAAISFITAIISNDGDFVDPIMILLIVILNAIIGTVQEYRAEKAVDALKKLSAPHAKVIRSGKETTIPSSSVVPGDIIIISSGDLMCADARILESTALKAEESSLTGESVPTDKSADIILPAESAPADRCNMLYSSTIIAAGHAKAVVTETGMNSRVGKIAAMLDEGESPKTPLQKSLAKTGKALGICAVIICAVIFGLGILQKIPPLDMFMISISLAVAAIPEGLPAIVTIVLAMGVRKMAKHRAIVRKLPAVETLGSANVICSDKTGTLTQNKMTAAAFSTANGSINAHSSEGIFLLQLAALCSNAKIEKTNITGDPTEKAIVRAAADVGQTSSELEKKFVRINEIPFDSKRKRMTTIHRLPTGGFRIIVKGAFDIIFELCTSVHTSKGTQQLDQITRKKISAENERLANKAMRVISVSYKDVPSMPSYEDIEKNLTFCGFIGLTDPPRPQAKGAVAMCKRAGIKTVMITGDHIVTAKAIAKELGIYSNGDKTATGAELDKISQDELIRHIFEYSVFARVSPEHKVRIVKAFQSAGAVAAMTGDGVNDAPALKCADIGCAMGLSGTDAAKSAADMILTDDNFATIVNAVSEGRGIFENIRRTVHFLLSSNIGEILTVLSAFLMRLPSPLLAIQLLWVNLVTDSLPALALGAEPTPPDIMENRPRNSNNGIFGNGAVRSIIIEGCFIGTLAFLAYTIGRVFYDGSGEPIVGRTMTFAVLSLSQLVHSFNLRSEHSIFHTGIFGNMKLVGAFILGTVMQVSVISIPFLSDIFKTIPLNSTQWLIVGILSIMPLIIVEIEKLFTSKNKN